MIMMIKGSKAQLEAADSRAWIQAAPYAATSQP